MKADDVAVQRRYYDDRSVADRDALFLRHVGLSRHVAGRFRSARDDREDLEQVAAIALLQAIDRFDPGRGIAFSTFAWATMHGVLKRHLRDHSWSIRPPRSLQERALAVSACLDVLHQELGRSPTIDEIAAAIGASAEDVLSAIEANAAFSLASLDAPGRDGEPFGARLSTDDPDVDDRLSCEALLRALPPRERRIVELRFEHGLTQSEIAAEVGLSQMHISRLLAKALATLRARAEELGLDAGELVG